MSEHIPFEIQLEIIKSLPVKSLIQFRSVSKSWMAFIDSSEFISGYGARHTQPPRQLIRYEDLVDRKEKYVYLVDDEHFSQEQFAPTLPVLTNLLRYSRIIGSSHGLLCSYGYYLDPGHSRFNSGTRIAVIWNPSIRKSIGIAVPGVLGFPFETVVGFGVCPVTSDPTIVKITYIGLSWEMVSFSSLPWQVQIFTLSSGTWRIPSSNLPRGSVKVTLSQVVMDKFIYWFAFDRYVANDGAFLSYNLIMSFDMSIQEFKVIDLPECLSHQFYRNFSISNVWESLAVLKYSKNNEKQVCDVWMMEDGVTKSFKKLLTIRTPYASIKTLGFRKNGKAIMETQDDYKEPVALEVYEPSSEHFSDVGIYGKGESFFVSSYMETLLLHDQTDGNIYANIN